MELFKLESSATPEHLIPRQYVAHQFAPFCQLVQPVHSPNQVAVKQEASAFDRQEKSSVKQEKPRPSERDVQEPSRRRLATLTEPAVNLSQVKKRIFIKNKTKPTIFLNFI